MIDLGNRALFPLEMGYALDLPSPLREYPPSSLHCALANDNDNKNPKGGGGGRPATHIRDKARRTPIPAAGRALAAPAAARVPPLSSLSLAAYPQYGSPPQQPHSASAAGFAPSPYACMSSLGHSHSPGSREDHLYHLSNSWELVDISRYRECRREPALVTDLERDLVSFYPRALPSFAYAHGARHRAHERWSPEHCAPQIRISLERRQSPCAPPLSSPGRRAGAALRCAVEDARGGVEVTRERHARSGSSNELYPKLGSSHGELLFVVIVVNSASWDTPAMA
ncbi:hypothetical protein B0H14DRAFT_3762000 [Mycena olivaceomarginata]|nr:hypothetical protein B0H14DRAFT_3762000 [Mycena olivaceomarginata]